jgi:hypothetical protein
MFVVLPSPASISFSFSFTSFESFGVRRALSLEDMTGISLAGRLVLELLSGVFDGDTTEVAVLITSSLLVDVPKSPVELVVFLPAFSGPDTNADCESSLRFSR